MSSATSVTSTSDIPDFNVFLMKLYIDDYKVNAYQLEVGLLLESYPVGDWKWQNDMTTSQDFLSF